MAVLGGMRSFWGPLIGAAIFVVLQDYISSQTENWMSFIGLFFVLVVLFFPRGVLGIMRRKADIVSLLAGRERLARFRQPRRRQRRLDVGRGRRAARGHRPQRRRQDDLLQSDQRISHTDLGPHPIRRRGYHEPAAGAARLARHRPHLSDHRGLPRAVGAGESAHRGRGGGGLSAAAVDLARGATARSARASPIFPTWAG